MSIPNKDRLTLFDYVGEDPPDGSVCEKMFYGEIDTISQDVGEILWWHAYTAGITFFTSQCTPFNQESEDFTEDDSTEAATRTDYRERDAQLEEFIEEIERVTEGAIVTPYKLETLESRLLWQDEKPTMAAFVLWNMRRLVENLETLSCGERLALVTNILVAEGIINEIDGRQRSDQDARDVIRSLARMGARSRHKETADLKEEIVAYWRANIAPTLTANKAANLLIRQFPISHRKAAEYVSEAKKHTS